MENKEIQKDNMGQGLEQCLARLLKLRMSYRDLLEKTATSYMKATGMTYSQAELEIQKRVAIESLAKIVFNVDARNKT